MSITLAITPVHLALCRLVDRIVENLPNIPYKKG